MTNKLKDLWVRLRGYKCYFCRKRCSWHPTQTYWLEKYIWDCHNCRARYYFLSGEPKALVGLYTNVGRDQYRVQFYDNMTIIAKYQLLGFYKDILFIHQDFQHKNFQHITPQTINQKLRTWLLFS